MGKWPVTDEHGVRWYPQHAWDAQVDQGIEIGRLHQRAVVLANDLGRQLKDAEARIADLKQRVEVAEAARKEMVAKVTELHQRLLEV